ncbi:MAG: hypothetical protein ACJA2Z_000289 [Candidatus Paceibacteria bacterium]|jgi:hypothetical protein
MKNTITKIQHFILFDIDSSSVGATLVRHGKNSDSILIKREELFSLRKNITNGNEYPFDRFFDLTCATLRKVADEILLQSLIHIDTIYVNVSTPWMSAQKRVINYEKKKPFIFTKELADELVEKEIASSFDHNIDYAKHDVDLIDRRIVDVYANGYPTRNALGKEMSQVEIHTLTSVMSKKTKQTFSGILEQVFHRDVTFVSNTFINYQSAQTLLPDINNAIVVDLAGEVTDVLLVKDDHLLQVGSIPVGTHHIVRTLRDTLKISINKAHSLLRLRNDNHLDEAYADSLENALSQAFTLWFKEFFNLLDRYAQSGVLPHTIVLKADTQTLSWVEEQILKQDHLAEHMHAGSKIEIITLFNNKKNLAFHDAELGIFDAFLAEQA